MSLTIHLNGDQRSFSELETGSAIVDLITALGLKADRIAVEQNGEIIPRSQWSGTLLKEKDKIEVVHFVGGGLIA
ncbi:MAG: sulfur carrier protein ThiS [Acidobacteria bacterium]|nr:sulfur carrier protein ThiS [Acidobacteriota bacterium]